MTNKIIPYIQNLVTNATKAHFVGFLENVSTSNSFRAADPYETRLTIVKGKKESKLIFTQPAKPVFFHTKVVLELF